MMRKLKNSIAMLLLVSINSAAHAQNITDLMPPGWKQEEYKNGYGGRTFSAPDGITIAEVDHINGNDGLVEAAESARDYLRPYGGDVLRKADAQLVPATNSYAAAGAWQDEDTGVKTMGISMARLHPSGRTWVCSFRTPMAAKMPDIMTKWLATCISAADKGYFVYDDDAKSAAARAKIASVPIKSGVNRPIEATLLEIYYISGVGGMILPDYKPIVLFKDGTAIRDFEQPAAEIDVGTFVKSQPNDVTRWTRTAKGYSIQWPDDDKAEETEASAERPKVFPAGHKLNDYWKRLSGSGNTAMGGDVSVAVSNGYRFFPDGRFSTDSAVSSSAPGVFVGSTGDKGGTYQLNGSALVLTYTNGKTKRLSIYYGGPINDPVLWLGGDSFTN
jgi:hypothetical protein